jgi:hypothetical protein
MLSFLQRFPNLQKATISWKIREPPYVPLRLTTGQSDDMEHLRHLEILLHPEDYDKDTFDLLRYGVGELLPLFRHLPLAHITNLGIFFEAFADSLSPDMDWFLEEFYWIMEEMRFRNLESIHLGFNFNVFGLPSFDLWVRFSVRQSSVSFG